MANTDFFTKVGNPGTATTLAAPGHAIAGTTFNVVSTSNWPTTTGAIFAVDIMDTVTGKRVPGSYTEWEGDVTNSTTISNAVIRFGTDQNYPAGSTTRVYIPVASSRENRLVDGILAHANQDGSLKPSAVQAALGTGNLANTGFNALGFAPTAVTYNGNRSYTCTFATDLTAVLSPGMRLAFDRTVNAQTQVTSLNGTNQYWQDTTVNGMTFTDDFTVSAWVKLNSYKQAGIFSRFDGTTGWMLRTTAAGQLELDGFGTAGIFRSSITNQSLPLNKWIHVAGTFDLSGAASSMYIDGVLVSTVLATSGAPSALVQAGNLQVGAYNGGAFFDGKIAQPAVFSAILPAATIRSYASQGLTGTEPNLVSAYSFNGTGNDSNTTNANNLTAVNGAAYNTDSPFSDGENAAAGLDYGIVMAKPTFSGGNTTVVVQTAESNAIPTSGGVTSVLYSSQKAPFGFPVNSGKWALQSIIKANINGTFVAVDQWINTNLTLTVPIGVFHLRWEGVMGLTSTVSGARNGNFTLSAPTPTNAIYNTQFNAMHFGGGFSSTGEYLTMTREDDVEVTAQTPYSVYAAVVSATGTEGWSIFASRGAAVITAENNYL